MPISGCTITYSNKDGPSDGYQQWIKCWHDLHMPCASTLFCCNQAVARIFISGKDAQLRDYANRMRLQTRYSQHKWHILCRHQRCECYKLSSVCHYHKHSIHLLGNKKNDSNYWRTVCFRKTCIHCITNTRHTAKVLTQHRGIKGVHATRHS